MDYLLLVKGQSVGLAALLKMALETSDNVVIVDSVPEEYRTPMLTSEDLMKCLEAYEEPPEQVPGFFGDGPQPWKRKKKR